MRSARPIRIFSILLFVLSPAWGQSANTRNTLKLDEGAQPPTATLADLDWLVGSWTGEAFGGSFEESWSHASAGSMVSTFKLIHDNRPSMYEFQMIVEENDSLIFKLKHFDADFSAWEEKEEFVSFPLVRLDGDTVWFEGLTYRRLGPDRLEVFIALEQTGEVHEERLVFERAQPDVAPTSAPPGPPPAPEPSPLAPESSLPAPAPERRAQSTRIYVGNLPFSVTGEQIQELFARYGTVSSVRLVTDPDTGRSLGTAFVEMAEGAEAAIEALDGGQWGRRLLTVEDAGARTEP